MENTNEPTNFTRYFYCGKTEDFEQTLEKLAAMAEPEIWTYADGQKFGILRTYLTGTLRRCITQDKFMYTKDKVYGCFNTGLLTPNGNDIVVLFKSNEEYKKINPTAQDWVLKGFMDNEELSINLTPHKTFYKTTFFKQHFDNSRCNIYYMQ